MIKQNMKSWDDSMIVDSEGSVAAAAKVPCSANDDSSSFVLDESLVADSAGSVAAAAKVLCGAKKAGLSGRGTSRSRGYCAHSTS